MKHKKLFVLALGSLMMAVVVAWWGMTLGHLAKTDGTHEPRVPQIRDVDADKRLQHVDIVLDPSSIKNLAAVESNYKSRNSMMRFLKISWDGIFEIDLGDSKLYFGHTTKLWGNGTYDKQPDMVFMYDGILYVAEGYGGHPFPRKQVDWAYRYQEVNITEYVPLELYAKGSDREVIETAKQKVGIEKISVERSLDGAPVSATVWRKDSEVKYIAPFKTVWPVEFLIDPAYDGADDYLTHINKGRRLPGQAVGTQVADLANGYTVSYPETLNGKPVALIDQGNNSYSFNTEDTPYDPDVATLYCFNYPSENVGPQSEAPVAIAPMSRSKLVDWGAAQEYFADVFSFTGPGYYCQMRVSQAFRLDMFKISF
ncbi:MAG TPA: hypothetical protein VGE35_01930 [Candidatus Paceibacterota bacterium]